MDLPTIANTIPVLMGTCQLSGQFAATSSFCTPNTVSFRSSSSGCSFGVLKQGFLCNPGCAGTGSVNQAILELRDLPHCAFPTQPPQCWN